MLLHSLWCVREPGYPTEKWRNNDLDSAKLSHFLNFHYSNCCIILLRITMHRMKIKHIYIYIKIFHYYFLKYNFYLQDAGNVELHIVKGTCGSIECTSWNNRKLSKDQV